MIEIFQEKRLVQVLKDFVKREFEEFQKFSKVFEEVMLRDFEVEQVM